MGDWAVSPPSIVKTRPRHECRLGRGEIDGEPGDVVGRAHAADRVLGDRRLPGRLGIVGEVERRVGQRGHDPARADRVAAHALAAVVGGDRRVSAWTAPLEAL